MRRNVVGTPAFLAPEAVSTTGVDQRADLYALGCVGYWLLTGQLVFEDQNAVALAIAHVTRVPDMPSQRIAASTGSSAPIAPVAPQLEAIIMQCLAKDREQRPATARALRQGLADIRFAEPWSRERAALWWAERAGHGDRRA